MSENTRNTAEMTAETAIAALRKLPQEKQRYVLAQLTPEKRREIYAKLVPQNGSQNGAQFGRTNDTVSAEPPALSIRGLKSRAYDLAAKGLNYLPTVGGIVGGVIGGTAATPADVVGGPAPSVGGAVLGSTLGGAGGEAARQVISRALFPDERNDTATDSMLKVGAEGAAQGFSEMTGQVFGKILGVTLAKTINKLYYAVRPSEYELGAIEKVYGDLARTAKTSGTQVNTVGDLLNLVDQTEKNVNKEVGMAMLQPVKQGNKSVPLGQMEVVPIEVSNRIKALAGTHPSEAELNPEKIKLFKDKALLYEKPHTFAWLNDRRVVLNNNLRNYYSLPKSERATYLLQHPEHEAEKAEAEAIRDLIYPAMDRAAGKPNGYFEALQQRHGALMSLKRATQENIRALELKSKTAAGAPWTEKANISTYGTTSGRPGASIHDLAGVVHTPNPLRSSNKRVASAFSDSAVAKARRVVGSHPQTSAEVLALPVRALSQEVLGQEYTVPKNRREAMEVLGR